MRVCTFTLTLGRWWSQKHMLSRATDGNLHDKRHTQDTYVGRWALMSGRMDGWLMRTLVVLGRRMRPRVRRTPCHP